MSATNPQVPTPGRPLALRFGVTEFIYLLGLAFLTIGVYLLWSLPIALLVCGCILLFTAFWNAGERTRGK